MPEKVHRELQRQANQKIHNKGKYQNIRTRKQAYVYGGMRRTGWKPKPPYTHKEGSRL